MRLKSFVRARLHRRLFVWFGATILMTGVSVSVTMMLMHPGEGPPWRDTYERIQNYVSHRFAEVWDDEPARTELAETAAREMGVGIVLEDASGRQLSQHGPSCRYPQFEAPVMREGVRLGKVSGCSPRKSPHGPLAVLMVLFVSAGTVWMASAFVARRLARPLGKLVDVTRRIGSGDLAVRARMPRGRFAEIGELADAIDDMAERIQRQMVDQRELLAAVSHEIRSPLSRLRILLELVRERGPKEHELDEIEQELAEIDSLVGELLASSRLDFKTNDHLDLDLRELAQRELERAAYDRELLEVDTRDTRVSGDPTLLSRALVNLLDNARHHAGGATRVVLAEHEGQLELAVEDQGPGFTDELLPVAFDSFVRGRRGKGSSLGLGLALVRRIAEAHGGSAFAENREAGGARVGLRLPRRG